MKSQHTKSYGLQLKQCLEKFIAVNAYLKKEKIKINDLTFLLKKL